MELSCTYHVTTRESPRNHQAKAPCNRRFFHHPPTHLGLAVRRSTRTRVELGWGSDFASTKPHIALYYWHYIYTYPIWPYVTSHYITLHYITLHPYITLYCMVLHYTTDITFIFTLPDPTLHYITLHYTSSLHYIIVHCMALYYVTFTLHYIWSH